MALLDNKFKQRMVGALVLIALAVIFLPMLFSRQDDMRQVRVEAPAAPQAPTVPQVQVEPVTVPAPPTPIPNDTPAPAPQAATTTPAQAPAAPIAATPTPVPTPPPVKATPAVKPTPAAAPVAAAPPAPAATKHIDAAGLPESWSVQLASLSNRASADSLQKTLRTQGYNAYIRSSDGMNRVFVGPLVERAEADRLNDQLSRQQKLKGFVVRFQPERG